MSYDVLSGLLDGFGTTSVVVLGDVMLDRFVYGEVERVSPEAPIPVLSVNRTTDMLGGAANVARNCASLGAKVTLIGVVGDDTGASRLEALLESEPGIDGFMLRDSRRPTTVKTRYIADQQQILRADSESREPLHQEVAAAVLASFETAVTNADIVILSDYAKGTLSGPVTSQAIEIARKLKKPVVVDPKSRDLSKYRGADILTPNRQELQLACGEECTSDEQVARAAGRILEGDVCEALIVTKGKDGMTIVARTQPALHIGTLAREVFDVSGAGDTALATLALGIAAGGTLLDAAKLANLCAGIVVGKRGTAVVTADEAMTGLNTLFQSEFQGKPFGLAQVSQQVRRWRGQGLKVAFTNGCFDLLHPGHISLLEQARGAADKLVVGLNSDASVTRLKGIGRPVQSEAARALVLSSLKCVDAVVLFAEDTPLSLIQTLEPDVLVKGADYKLENIVGADLVTARGGRVFLADFKDGHSTTGLIQRSSRS